MSNYPNSSRHSHLPKVSLSDSNLEFKATRLGEFLKKTITIKNSTPKTVLKGFWEVAPHACDPPHTPETHPWISFGSAKFKGNSVECSIMVDTHQLMPDQVYERQLLLHTNLSTETQIVNIKVQTAPLPSEARKVPYDYLGVVFALSAIAAAIGASVTAAYTATFAAKAVLRSAADARDLILDKAFGACVGAFMVGLVAVVVVLLLTALLRRRGLFAVVPIVGLAAAAGAIIVAAAPIAAAIATGHPGPVIFGIMGIGMCGVMLLPAVDTATVDKKFLQIGFSKLSSVGILLLTTASGVSLGIGHTLGFFNTFVISAFVGTSLLLAAMIFYSDLNRTKVIARYRQSEPHLTRQSLNFKEQTVAIPIDNKNLTYSLFAGLLLLGSLQTSAAWAGIGEISALFVAATAAAVVAGCAILADVKEAVKSGVAAGVGSAVVTGGTMIFRAGGDPVDVFVAFVVAFVVAAVIAGSVAGAAAAFGVKAMNEDLNGYLGVVTGIGAAVAVLVGFFVGILGAFVVGNEVEEAVKMINLFAATPIRFANLAFRMILLGCGFGYGAKMAGNETIQKGFSHSFTVVFLLLTVAFGIILGIVIIQLQAGLPNPLTMLALAGTGILLATMIFYPCWQRARIIAKYRQSHPYLIKP